MSEPVLEVDDLDVTYKRFGLGRARHIHAVSGATLSVERGEVVAVIGESGSGKSTLVRAVVGLVPIKAGAIKVGGRDVIGCSDSQRRQRLRPVQMVFQNPYASLSPHLKVGDIVAEPLDIWERKGDPEVRKAKIRQALETVGIEFSRVDEHTGTFSGGQRQRIALARALIADPELLICDEVLSSLDVSSQAQILDILNDLKRQHRFGMLLISHNLAVLRYIADRVAVMYAGVIVETGPTEQIIDHPRHPYTKALVAAARVVDIDQASTLRVQQPVSETPDPAALPAGCVYQGNCPSFTDACAAARPAALELGHGVTVRCIHVEASTASGTR